MTGWLSGAEDRRLACPARARASLAELECSGWKPKRRGGRGRLTSLPASASEGIASMCPSTTDSALAACGGVGFKQNGVDVGKVLELKSRDFLADETLDCLQRG